MNNHQIDKILNRNPLTKKYYKGCVPSDRIPYTYKYGFPYCLCVNTDPSYKDGQHWVAFFIISPTKVEYYDSLGEWPPISRPIKNFIRKFSQVEYNDGIIQNPLSSTCGLHAIYFLLQRCRGRSFIAIIEGLLNKKLHADTFVRKSLRNNIFK